MHLSTPRVLGVIPMRYGSQRFPGKALAPLAGKTLIQHTIENALKADCFDDLVVATDDERIYRHVEQLNVPVFMTCINAPSGTARIIDFLIQNPAYKPEIVVNIQGDEPCVSQEAFRKLIDTLRNSPTAVMSTLVTPLTNPEHIRSPSIVKCIRNLQGNALYFSRAMIPSNKQGEFALVAPYYRHIGVYAYRREFLLQYAELEDTPLQQAEDLEQLKVLEHGYTIATACVKEEAIGVDTPQDIQLVERILCTANTFS